MTTLGIDRDAHLLFNAQHNQWTTSPADIKEVLGNWGMVDVVIGERIPGGEVSEVYPIHDRSTNDLLGYLRIARRGNSLQGDTEQILMEACRDSGLPSIQILHSRSVQLRNGQKSSDAKITFVSPAIGRELLDAIESDEISSEIMREVSHQAGIFLARMHRVRDTNETVSETIYRYILEDKILDIQAFFDACVASMGFLPDAQHLLRRIEAKLPSLIHGLDRAKKDYPLVIAHTDFAPKHVFFDENSGDLTSVIDFGSTYVGIPHSDFPAWRTFSPVTYDGFLQGYLAERFGDDLWGAQHFVEEIDFADAIWQLDYANYRMGHLLVPEAVGHLQLCVNACNRIMSRTIEPCLQWKQLAL